jgi:hypothetical protein
MPLGSKPTSSSSSSGDDRVPGSLPPVSGPGSAEAPPATSAPPRRGDAPRGGGAGQPGTMIPARGKRFAVESFVMRIIATAGIVGISVAIAAIMASQDVQGWIIGLVISLLSVVLAGVLWSSRRL